MTAQRKTPAGGPGSEGIAQDIGYAAAVAKYSTCPRFTYYAQLHYLRHNDLKNRARARRRMAAIDAALDSFRDSMPSAQTCTRHRLILWEFLWCQIGMEASEDVAVRIIMNWLADLRLLAPRQKRKRRYGPGHTPSGPGPGELVLVDRVAA